MAKFLKLIKNDKGATAIEYGLIAALIAVAAITAMTSIGSKLGSTFNNVSSNLDYEVDLRVETDGGVARRRRFRVRAGDEDCAVQARALNRPLDSR